MSRTISQLTAGTKVYVDETVSGVTNHVPYIYLGLDEGGNARLLRQYAAIQKRMHSSNVASYSGCEADVWLEDEENGFLSRFDAETIDALRNTSISYTDYNQSGDGTVQLLTIARRCFLLSYTEEGWSATAAGSEGQSYLDALKTFTGETGDNAARIGYNESGTAVNVWMRSAYSATSFRYVYNNGNAYSSYASDTGYWLRPALSIAPATSVSDEGADAIFLLPEGRRTYWGIEAVVSLGESEARPAKAKLIIDKSDGVYETTYHVCNNLQDTTPTWVECEDGGVCALAETKTGDDWELGVKISVKASGPKESVGEPALIVIMDEQDEEQEEE